jgi:hypothetical protein
VNATVSYKTKLGLNLRIQHNIKVKRLKFQETRNVVQSLPACPLQVGNFELACPLQLGNLDVGNSKSDYLPRYIIKKLFGGLLPTVNPAFCSLK